MFRTAEVAQIRQWRVPCYAQAMFTRVARLFTIKTKFEAFLVIYGLGMGAVERGIHYMQLYPGFGGKLLFAVCPIAVFMAGGRVIDSIAAD